MEPQKRRLLRLILLSILTVGLASCTKENGEEPVRPVIPSEQPDTPETPDNPPPTTKTATGWPEHYDGVMLQGFYWDSYADTQWSVLEQQADELSRYFNLIWVPQSGYCNSMTNQMGYSDIWWLDHKSAFGSEEELRSMIKTFKQKGTGIIADVVVNHKNGNTSWCDFPNESKNGYVLTWDNATFSAICANDECNTNVHLAKWSKEGRRTTGATDTGDNFDGARDLDHTNAQVQQNVKSYLNFLLKDLGYSGFRYDMVKGYAAKYVGMYNSATQPVFSVGEYWDNNKTMVVNWLRGTGQDGTIQSAAFDFPLKDHLNAAFGAGAWAELKRDFLAGDGSVSRYAVTFVDNHDTYRNNHRLKSNVCAANAFILTMPGTPCLFLKHWQSNKGTLKRLITLRKAAGITNMSTVVNNYLTVKGAYVAVVKGEKGTLMLCVGNDTLPETDGNDYTLALKGRNFAIYAGKEVDLTTVQAITDKDSAEESTVIATIPAFCQVNKGENCAFFEAPTSWKAPIKCWRWDNSFNYTTNTWPGVNCTLIGTADNGHQVWKWFWDGQKVSQQSPNEGIIFNDGSNQTGDMRFVNGGYYNEEGLQGMVAAGNNN